MRNLSIRHILLSLAFLVAAAGASGADFQELEAQTPSIDNPGSGRKPVYRGKYHTVTPEGDTVLVVIFNDITVFPKLRFKNRKQEEFYWRTVRDVKKALPYAKLISATLLETYEYLETFPTQKEREAYLKEMEGAIFRQYKPALKRFTKGQARMLVKLIQRETNQSGYDIVKAFLGSFRASFWQGFGKLFGVSLKGEYRPEKNADDAIIERVCVGVEQGEL
ncbi:MAG: DUF4294 domain-containing protein [[Clostridium] fimetarium]|nr:DUF4294 domain-containing protein [Alistipes timonensis]MCM1406234.1 DUF4294 domain-containing protein [[Clostridium] fimetarium]